MRLLTYLLSALALAPALLAQRAPEVEPNNTAATAQVVAMGTQIDASLAAGEQDWFTFTLTTSDRVHVQVTTSNLPPTVDPVLQLWNAAGTQVLGVDVAYPTSNGYRGSLTLDLTAGTYALQVLGRSTTTTGIYSIDIGRQLSLPYTGSEVEPNNSVATATPTVLGPGVNRFQGNLAADTLVSNRTVSYGFIVSSHSGQGSGTTTVTVATPTFTPGAYEGGAYSVFIRGGTGPVVGQTRRIISNTATTITTDPWPGVIGSVIFDIYFTTSTHAIVTTTALTNAAWNANGTIGRFQVRWTSGVNNGQRRLITANTASYIQLEQPMPNRPGLGDNFVVESVDSDLWRVALTAPHTGLWFRVVEGQTPWVFGHRVSMLDSTGALVDSATLGRNNVEAAAWTDIRSSERRVWPAGTYYLVVRRPSFTTSPIAPGITTPASGNYALEIHCSPMDTGGIAVETEAVGSSQSNGSAATAVPIAPGQIGRGNITISTDSDPSDWWGPIVVSVPSTLTFQTRSGAAPFAQDTTVNLRDANGALVASATDGNLLSPTSHARSVLDVVLAPQAYYLEVVSPGTDAATQAGNYELQLGAITPVSTVTAAYANVGGNGLDCYNSIALSSTSNAGGPNSIVSNTPLTPKALSNGAYWLRITSGANAGQVRPIVSNDAAQIVVSPSFPSGVAGSTFDVLTSPTIVRQFSSELPAEGTLFARQLISCPASSPYLHMIGFSNTQLAGSGPLPIDLSSLGAPGCWLHIDPVLTEFGITNGSGSANLQMTIPSAIDLRGITFFEQALVGIPTANTFGAVATNYGRAFVGDRNY